MNCGLFTGRPADAEATHLYNDAFLYGVLMLPILLQPPLGTMLAPRLRPWLALVPALSKRLASHSVP